MINSERDHYNVANRYIIEGIIELVSPACITNGESKLTDRDIYRDEISHKPILPGTSLAGALRDYLCVLSGEGSNEVITKNDIEMLFGVTKTDDAGYSDQSLLYIEDSFGIDGTTIIRDGVAIDSSSKIAIDKQKFDMELLAQNSTFSLRIEFWEPRGNSNLLQLLAIALKCLQEGKIRVGGRKSRGLGKCNVHEWQVSKLNMKNPVDILRWIEDDMSTAIKGSNIAKLLNQAIEIDSIKKNVCHLRATFDIQSSMLIRSTSTDIFQPDSIQLRNNAGKPIIPGTSLAGALRSRATLILNVNFNNSIDKTTNFISDLFGSQEKTGQKPSKIWVEDTEILNSIDNYVQTRIKIDRFTGGAFPGALFTSNPVFKGEVTLNIEIIKPTEEEVGLLLLLLKDLWTENLTIGGETSIGRGRLIGKEAEIKWDDTWIIKKQEDGLVIVGDQNKLEETIAAIRSYRGD